MSKAREVAKMGEVLTNNQIGGRRNLVINGSMICSQRASSATTMTNAYATVDRFRGFSNGGGAFTGCLLYTSPSPRDTNPSRMPSSA